MTLFPPSDAPRVFALPPGVDFSRALAKGLADRLSDAPSEALAGVTLALNTRRTARAVERAFEAERRATFLPRMRMLDDFARGAAGGPPAIQPLPRRLAMRRIVRDFLGARPGLGSLAATGGLADALISLLDELYREGLSPETLPEIKIDERHAAHWGVFAAFFRHIAAAWPDMLAEIGGVAEAEAIRAADLAALRAAWSAAPPSAPIIAAGSTGSQRLTAELLAEIARLPQGAVVLPGFDATLARDAWTRLGPDHPQFGLRRLLERMSLNPGDVQRWETDAPAPSARARLLSQALRPAPVTHEWRGARDALAAEAEAATGDIAVIEAENPQREADAIAAAIRAELDRDGADVALVTPDRTLGRRVAASLRRWGVVPDESGGQPLALTPPGVFISLSASLLAKSFSAVDLLSLLKHPLFSTGGPDPEARRRAVRRLELDGLRARDLGYRLTDIETVLTATDRKGAPLVEADLAAALAALRRWPTAAPLGALVQRHLDTLQTLAGASLWDKSAGRAAWRAMEAFRDAADIYGEAEPAEYPALLTAALDASFEDPPYLADPRVRVLGALEARAQSADLVILGGLNEGVWPAAPPVDPWLSRPMRAEIGLPSPERQIGLSAHDFLQAASAPRVILTRAVRDGGAPTVESRWLTRLRTLLNGLPVDDAAPVAAMTTRGRRWLDAASALDAPLNPKRPEPRPEPRPPTEARPRRISVTDVEKLIRDPYAVYARRVLRLNPLEPPGALPDARQRGEALHAMMERLAKATKTAWPPDPGPLYDRLADEIALGADVSGFLAAVWRARLARIKPTLLEAEAARRDEGAPLGAELGGELAVKTALGEVKLVGRADRIDRLTAGGLAIYDYKAGATPTQKQASVFAKQLPLLAAMAAAGVIEGVPAEAATRLAYLSLADAKAARKMVEIEPETDALTQLSSLLAAFLAPETPFLPRAYVEKAKGFAGDYDHLSRYGEWSDTVSAAPPPGGGSLGEPGGAP